MIANHYNSTFKVKPKRRRNRSRYLKTPQGTYAEKGSIRILESVLDDLVRKVLHREQRVCFVDGLPAKPGDPLEISHYFGRARRPTRFDVHPGGNNVLMHRSCNALHNHDKSNYRNAYVKRWGEAALVDLERRANSSAVFDYMTLHAMIQQRQSMI
jgi:hypothetical protein